MLATVRDFMNPRLVYIRVGCRPSIALQPILDFGITAVPVLDDNDYPVGVVSLRDIVDRRKTSVPASAPAICVRFDASIDLAARKLVEGKVHHLVVVNAIGQAIGMLSTLDVLRAELGLEPSHPSAIEEFGHRRVDASAPQEESLPVADPAT